VSTSATAIDSETHVRQDLDDDHQRGPHRGDRKPLEGAPGSVVRRDGHHDVLQLVQDQEDGHPGQHEVEEADPARDEPEIEILHQAEGQDLHRGRRYGEDHAA
jgi:hypothetical protein